MSYLLTSGGGLGGGGRFQKPDRYASKSKEGKIPMQQECVDKY